MARTSRRRRTLIGAIALIALLILGWQLVAAEDPAASNPVQAQVKQFLPSLRDSEAEYASGAYIPGVGAIYTIDLIRGPNSVKGKPSYEGTRDWAIYLMQSFGAKLDRVPRTETIAISVDFYDFTLRTNRQLVIRCLAADAATPDKYAIFLDGQPYAEAVARSVVAQPAASGAAAPTATRPSALATPTGRGTAATPGVATTAAGGAAKAPTPTAGLYTGTLTFDDPQAAQSWITITGRWSAADGTYSQLEEGKFDLIALLNRRLSGDYSFQVDLTYLAGEMGGGLVFNVPTDGGKQGAQMVSYTAGGKYLHWGVFDANGVFQFQGGATVPDGADGKKHTLGVQVSGTTYSVTLDGTRLGGSLPLSTTTPGYVGLIASTSQVRFDNVKVESK